jgi:Tfp pilus assembly protein PilX
MMRRRGINQEHKRSRRGVLMVVMLACIAVVGLLTAASLKTSLDWRRQVRHQTRIAQAEWLAESGLARAVFKLKQNADYVGETWTVTTDDGLRLPAKVQITIDKTNQTAIRVKASLGEDLERPVRISRTLVIGLSEGAKEND